MKDCLNHVQSLKQQLYAFFFNAQIIDFVSGFIVSLENCVLIQFIINKWP